MSLQTERYIKLLTLIAKHDTATDYFVSLKLSQIGHPKFTKKLVAILQHVPTLLSHKRDTLATRRNVLHALAHDIAAI